MAFIVACCCIVLGAIHTAVGLRVFLTMREMFAQLPPGITVASTQSLGLASSVLQANDVAFTAAPWQDLSDFSWDARGSTIEASATLTSRPTHLLLGIPLGPHELALSVQVSTTGELTTPDAARVRDKLLSNLRTATTPTEDPRTNSALFPDAVAYDIRTTRSWAPLASTAFAPSALVPNPASPPFGMQASKSYWDTRYPKLWGFFAFGPTVLLVACTAALRLRRRLRNTRTGCERCGYPIEPETDGATWHLPRCSECGHSTRLAASSPLRRLLRPFSRRAE